MVEFIIGSATRSSRYHRTRIDLYRIIYWSSNYLRRPSEWRNKRSAPIFIMCTTASSSPSIRLSACADFIFRLSRIDERRKHCFYVNNVVLIQQQYNSCYYYFYYYRLRWFPSGLVKNQKKLQNIRRP